MKQFIIDFFNSKSSRALSEMVTKAKEDKSWKELCVAFSYGLFKEMGVLCLIAFIGFQIVGGLVPSFQVAIPTLTDTFGAFMGKVTIVCGVALGTVTGATLIDGAFPKKEKEGEQHNG